MRLNQQEATDLLEYIDDETLRITGQAAAQGARTPTAMLAANSSEDVVGIMNAWVRETDAAAKANAGYMTLLNVANEEVTLVSIESAAFEKIEMHEMANVDGLMTMRKMNDLVIPANGSSRFSKIYKWAIIDLVLGYNGILIRLFIAMNERLLLGKAFQIAAQA